MYRCIGRERRVYSTTCSILKMAKRNRKSHYAVARGRRTGIYGTWAECQAQVDGYPGAKFKGFVDRAEAQDFMVSNGVVGIGDRANGQNLNVASSLVASSSAGHTKITAADVGVVDLCAQDTADADADADDTKDNIGSNGYQPSAKKARTNPYVGSNDEKKPAAKSAPSSEPVNLCGDSEMTRVMHMIWIQIMAVSRVRQGQRQSELIHIDLQQLQLRQLHLMPPPNHHNPNSRILQNKKVQVVSCSIPSRSGPSMPPSAVITCSSPVLPERVSNQSANATRLSSRNVLFVHSQYLINHDTTLPPPLNSQVNPSS